MKRRKFIKTSGTVIACTCAVGSLNACKAISGVSKTPLAAENSYTFSDGTLTIDLSKNPNLLKAGSSIKLEFEAKKELQKILIAKTKENDYQVFTNKCTHGQREIEYMHNENKFQCVSFGHSQYDSKGSVIKGPAPKALKKHEVIIVGNNLLIKV